MKEITDVATPTKWKRSTAPKTIGEPLSGNKPSNLRAITPFSTVNDVAKRIIAPFRLPNLFAKKGETTRPTSGAKNKLNPIVNIFNGVNSQKKL